MNHGLGNVLTYEECLKEYNKQIRSNNYLFLIKKCCGYGFLFPFNKQATLQELYTFIGYEIKPSKPIHLYLSHQLIHLNQEIPHLDTPIETYLKDPIRNRNIKPLYKLPDPVVYEIYLNDGHHSDCRAIFG